MRPQYLIPCGRTWHLWVPPAACADHGSTRKTISMLRLAQHEKQFPVFSCREMLQADAQIYNKVLALIEDWADAINLPAYRQEYNNLKVPPHCDTRHWGHIKQCGDCWNHWAAGLWVRVRVAKAGNVANQGCVHAFLLGSCKRATAHAGGSNAARMPQRLHCHGPKDSASPPWLGACDHSSPLPLRGVMWHRDSPARRGSRCATTVTSVDTCRTAPWAASRRSWSSRPAPATRTAARSRPRKWDPHPHPYSHPHPHPHPLTLTLTLTPPSPSPSPSPLAVSSSCTTLRCPVADADPRPRLSAQPLRQWSLLRQQRMAGACQAVHPDDLSPC